MRRFMPIIVFVFILSIVTCGLVTCCVGVCPDRVNPDLGCRIAITVCGIFDILFAVVSILATKYFKDEDDEEK